MVAKNSVVVVVDVLVVGSFDDDTWQATQLISKDDTTSSRVYYNTAGSQVMA
jgi:uncharacterized protein YtpQ (UPF0354 family)